MEIVDMMVQRASKAPKEKGVKLACQVSDLCTVRLETSFFRRFLLISHQLFVAITLAQYIDGKLFVRYSRYPSFWTPAVTACEHG